MLVDLEATRSNLNFSETFYDPGVTYGIDMRQWNAALRAYQKEFNH